MSTANPYATFIRELKAVRIARKLTQQQVASLVRLSRPQYAAIEHGRSTANFRHIYNLAIALNVHWVIGKPDSTRADMLAQKAA